MVNGTFYLQNSMHIYIRAHDLLFPGLKFLCYNLGFGDVDIFLLAENGDKLH